MDSGQLPALAALREEGYMAAITSAFPSVTGPAYAPFLMGRYPGAIGLPGLRWFDRTRRISRLPGHSRSYVGAEMRLVDRDIDRASPTIFELAKPSLGALSVISRGLPRGGRIGQSAAFIARAAATHFRGNVRGWLAIDRDVGDEAARRLRTRRVRFAFIAMTGIDKTSHAEGHDSQTVLDAMKIVDETVAQIRADAEREADASLGRQRSRSLASARTRGSRRPADRMGLYDARPSLGIQRFGGHRRDGQRQRHDSPLSRSGTDHSQLVAWPGRQME
jgi:hypothetical protein